MDVRANLLPGEYKTKARNTDRKYGGVGEGEMGRLEQKLISYGRVRGLVVGSWSELSNDFKELLFMMTENRKRIIERQPYGG